MSRTVEKQRGGAYTESFPATDIRVPNTMSNRLKSGLLVRAGARTCNARGVPAFVVRKGDEDAGAVYVKLNHMNGDCVVLSQVRTQDGDAAWMRATCDNGFVSGDTTVGRSVSGMVGGSSGSGATGRASSG